MRGLGAATTGCIALEALQALCQGQTVQERLAQSPLQGLTQATTTPSSLPTPTVANTVTGCQIHFLLMRLWTQMTTLRQKVHFT